ncbi:MAG: chorismate lyase [Vibrio sp.]|uniref:chorismate lyase n=1 Tax=Vibrio sp. TaxID=678 RepID=UPI003A895AB5
MNQSTSLYLTALSQVNWSSPEKFTFPDANAKAWLLEKGSLSRRLAENCHQLTVDLLNNQWVESSFLAKSETDLLPLEPCLLRTVILQGDGKPWIVGRTLIPKSSVQDQSHNLEHQGEIPLGLTVFSADNVKRDALQVGWVETSDSKFLARRSRLWMNNKPMLVAELFLRDSPAYFSKEQA